MFKKVFLAFFFSFFIVNAQVKINEYSCANLSSFADNFGNFEDWVELYNPSTSPVNLSGYFLSDVLNKPTKWTFGTGVTIPAGGFLRIWASGRNVNTGPNLHTNFKLTQTEPEMIVLRDPSQNIVDSIVLRATQAGHSYGRTTDGAATWNVFDVPTPNASNNTSTPKTYCPRPVMSFTPGFYPSSINVAITVPSGYTVRYTTNGSTPNTGSTLYSSPVNISTTRVLRARTFSSNPNELPSFIESNTYFINASHTLAVVSVYGDQLQNLMNGSSSLKPETGLEYFDASHIFKTESYGKSNKHGNDSWAYPQRGIDYISMDEYGYNHALKSKFFPNKQRKRFQKIILKAAANDNYPFSPSGGPGMLEGAHIRDAYCHTLSQKAKLHLDERTWAPCVMYVNGQYWGVYEIREKVDDMDFFDYYYDADIKDSVRMLKTWGATWAEYGGPPAIADWNNLKNYILTNNLTIPANYNYVTGLLDVKSLADYVILNSLTVSADWLNWNTKWWRAINYKSKQKKWKYCLWDLDATFKHYINYTSIPNMNANANPCDPQTLNDPGGQGHIPILNKLLQNPTFKQYYVMRYFDLLNNGLSCQRMVTVLDSMINEIAPEMNAHVAKWGGTYNQWYSNYQALRNFILQRCSLVVNGFANCYNTTGPFKIKVNVSPPGAGMVQFNSLLLNNFVWTGNYPGNLDIILKAIPSGSFCFDHWSVQSHTPSPGVNNDSITINLTTVDSIVAVFVPVVNNISITATPSYVCKGESLQLQVNVTGTSVVWDAAAPLSCTSCPSTAITPTANTNVSVTVSSNCINGGTTYLVKVYDYPGSTSPDFTPASCAPYTTQITLPGGMYYSWTPTTGLSCNTCSNPVIQVDGMLTYSVIMATDPNFRCADTSVFTVYLEAMCPEVYIPNGFSPNGDGNNDIFRVYGFTNHFQMIIYNRWGEKIYESTDPKEGWDGKYKGELVPSGVYAILISGNDEKGNYIRKTGNINVFR